jgi:hypothetical protein
MKHNKIGLLIFLEVQQFKSYKWNHLDSLLDLWGKIYDDFLPIICCNGLAPKEIRSHYLISEITKYSESKDYNLFLHNEYMEPVIERIYNGLELSYDQGCEYSVMTAPFYSPLRNTFLKEESSIISNSFGEYIHYGKTKLLKKVFDPSIDTSNIRDAKGYRFKNVYGKKPKVFSGLLYRQVISNYNWLEHNYE